MSDRAQVVDHVRMPAGVFAAMRTSLGDDRGAVEAAHLLRHIGVESGEAFFELFRDWLSDSQYGAGDPGGLVGDQFWIRLSEFFEHLGWGRLESEQIHPGVISVAATGWVEARASGSSPQGCHFTTGLLADLLRRVADQELAAMEVECAATGSAHCSFLIGSPLALEAVFARMSEGSHYREAIAALA